MTVVDARGLRCPWPAIRAARAIREGAEQILIDADDPNAGAELAALAHATGRRLETLSPNRFRLRID